jgi:hypothetical protein
MTTTKKLTVTTMTKTTTTTPTTTTTVTSAAAATATTATAVFRYFTRYYIPGSEFARRKTQKEEKCG